MTTPRNSMVGAFPAEPLKGPIAMHAAQKVVPRRVPVVVGPTQSFFMREAKALGAVQIMNGLFHIALGSLMLIHMDVYMPICVTLWYPLWGGIMFIISGSLLAAAEKNSTQSMNVVLLSAEEKKEQAIEIKEEVVEQIEVAEQIEISSLPKNEEDIEIIPVQEEEEEEAEMNFPEPPQDQEDSPIENDSVP